MQLRIWKRQSGTSSVKLIKGSQIVGKTEDDYDDLWNQDDPWAPTDDDTRGDYEHDIYRQRELDDEWLTDSK